MAKIKNIDKLANRLRRLLKDVSEDKTMLTEIATFTVDRIVKSTRSGKSIPKGEKLADLATPWTVVNRNYLSKFNNTHELYKKGRSNLTFTGQLLDSFRYFIKNNEISFRFIGDHKPYKTGKTRKRKKKKSASKISNAELAEYMEKGDRSANRPARPFVGLDDKMIERIKRIVSKNIRTKSKK